MIVSIWFRTVEGQHMQKKADDANNPGVKKKSKRRGPFKWFRSFRGNPSTEVGMHKNNKACLGWTAIPIDGMVNNTKSGWVTLPKCKDSNGEKKQKNPPQQWTKKPLNALTDYCYHAKEFQIELNLNVSYHKKEFNEKTRQYFNDKTKTYFEVARMFYRHAMLRHKRFNGELTGEGAFILATFGKQRQLTECSMKMLNLAAIMSLQSSVSMLIVDTDQQFLCVHNAVQIHHQKLCQSLPKNNPNSSLQTQNSQLSSLSILTGGGGRGLEQQNSLSSLSGRSSLSSTCEIFKHIDSISKLALEILIDQATNFVTTSVQIMDQCAPSTFPLTDEALDYLYKRVDIIWQVMYATYLPKMTKENLQISVRQSFSDRFIRDSAGWFQKKIETGMAERPRSGSQLRTPGMHQLLQRKLSTNDANNKMATVDSLDNLRTTITTLVDALQEATSHCTPKISVLTQLRTYRLSYFPSVALGIDSIAVEQVKQLLPRFLNYQKKHQVFQSNLTITSGLSFKLYKMIVNFARLARETIEGSDGFDSSNCPLMTPMTMNTLTKITSSAALANMKSLCQYEEMFQPCVVYWMHAIRDMSITRIRDAVSGDTTMAVLYETPVSASAYDTVTCIVEMIQECRIIEFSDPRQLMLINVRAVDIACELVLIYANAIIKQAHSIVNNDDDGASDKSSNDTANGDQSTFMQSPRFGRRRKSSANEIEYRETKEVGERLMRALRNIQHVSDEIWKRLEHFDDGNTVKSWQSSRDTGIGSSGNMSMENTREEQLVRDLMENCKSTLGNILDKCMRSHAKVAVAKHEYLIQDFLESASGPDSDRLMSAVTELLITISSTLEGTCAVQTTLLYWSHFCEILLRNLKTKGRRPSYYSKVLRMVNDMEQMFSATETDRIVIFPRYLQENENFKKLIQELEIRSQDCRNLIKTYLSHCANCDAKKLGDSTKNSKAKKVKTEYFMGKDENHPIKEGEMYLQLGKVEQTGTILLACKLTNRPFFYLSEN